MRTTGRRALLLGAVAVVVSALGACGGRDLVSRVTDAVEGVPGVLDATLETFVNATPAPGLSGTLTLGAAGDEATTVLDDAMRSLAEVLFAEGAGEEVRIVGGITARTADGTELTLRDLPGGIPEDLRLDRVTGGYLFRRYDLG